MDVSCPQCRTEYEFEDARIPDDGLTVKCTQCGHVFRMKKKAPAPAQVAPSFPGPADEGREWRLRQPSGNVFGFKHLTTLQKWIVERKVQKQDEISLTGESWKRLGDIAELASFFQVVDDASRGAAAAKAEPVSAPAAPPLSLAEIPSRSRSDTLPPEAPIKPKLTDTLPGPGFSAQLTPHPAAPAPLVHSGALHNDQTIRGQSFSITPGGGPPAPALKKSFPPAGPVRSALRQAADVDEDDIKLQKQGGAMKWVALALIILGAGGAGAYYFVTVYQPEQQRRLDEQAQAAEHERTEQARAAAQKQIEESAAKARTEQEAAAALAASRRDAVLVVDAGAVAAVPDAGAIAGVVAIAALDAGTSDAGAKAAVPPKPMDFDQLLAAGERLRARDRAAAALALFTKAAELKPDRVEPQSSGGFALLDMEKPIDAELAFRGALQLNPRYGPALIGMAEASKQLGKKQQAIDHYQRYLDVLPNGPEAAVAKNSIERLKAP